MARRKSQINDSLDLLLDAISNTFGGILFLAVLVALLVQFGGNRRRTERRHTAPAASQSELRDQLKQRSHELEALRRAVEAQRASLAQFKPAEVKPIVNEVLALRITRADLEGKRIDLVMRIAQMEDANRVLADKVREVVTQLQDAKAEESRLGDEIDKIVRKRTRTAQLPALRTTHKHEFPLLMRYGRIFLPYATERDQARKALNLDEFVVLSDDRSRIRVTPKPYAGLLIDETEGMQDALKRKLTGLDPKAVYLAIGVWEDSFAEFVHLRNALVDLGWEYRLIPTEEGGFIAESPLANPLVQ